MIAKSTTERVTVTSQDVGALVLRVAAGGVLAIHGTQHLFGWFSGPGMDGFTNLVSGLGYEAPRAFATIGGISEVVGGLLLIFGFLTPLGVAAAVGQTANAVIAFHPSQAQGFWATLGDFPLLLGLTAIGIAFVGPGVYSLDRGRRWVHGDTSAALAGIGIGAVVALIALLIKVI